MSDNQKPFTLELTKLPPIHDDGTQDVPVLRGAEFKRLFPNNLSLWTVPAPGGPTFKLSLQYIESREDKHHLRWQGGVLTGTPRKTTQLEIHELATVEFSTNMLLALKTEIENALKLADLPLAPAETQ